MAELVNILRARAAELGLDVGISAPAPGAEGAHLRSWLDAGHHAQMAWLAREPARRVDPRRVLEGARAVISVGLPYWSGGSAAGSLAGHGRIARYAVGADYHEVLLARVRALAEVLDDPAARCYVDTGPVLEKARAARAGLGWQGRHSNLVSTRHGSWWSLGAILTTRALPADEPHPDRCGRCTRCLDACPTGAISPGRSGLDARRCISYLTIELRGPIPRALRPLIGDWIYGCDLCLEVCPWNRFARAAVDERLRPREGLDHPSLLELLGWDQATFSRRMKGSPIKRTKRRGLLRNVCVALGNAGDRGAVAALARVLSEEAEPLVRGHAAWALGQLGGGPARRALERAADEADAFVREEVRLGLA